MALDETALSITTTNYDYIYAPSTSSDRWIPSDASEEEEPLSIYLSFDVGGRDGPVFVVALLLGADNSGPIDAFPNPALHDSLPGAICGPIIWFPVFVPAADGGGLVAGPMLDGPTEGPMDGPILSGRAGPIDGPIDGPVDVLRGTDGPIEGPIETVGPIDGPIGPLAGGPMEGPIIFRFFFTPPPSDSTRRSRQFVSYRSNSCAKAGMGLTSGRRRWINAMAPSKDSSTFLKSNMRECVDCIWHDV